MLPVKVQPDTLTMPCDAVSPEQPDNVPPDPPLTDNENVSLAPVLLVTTFPRWFSICRTGWVVNRVPDAPVTGDVVKIAMYGDWLFCPVGTKEALRPGAGGAGRQREDRRR